MSVMVEAARKLGKFAAQLGHGITVCPYRPSGGPMERAAARAWVEEYLRWNPTAANAVNYDEESDVNDGDQQSV